MTTTAPTSSTGARGDLGALLDDDLREAMHAVGLDDPAEHLVTPAVSRPADVAGARPGAESGGMRRSRTLVRVGYAVSILLVLGGLAVFGVTAYLLWGTGWYNERAQNELRAEFDALVAEASGDEIDAAVTEPAAPAVVSPAAPDLTTAPAEADDELPAPAVATARTGDEADLTGFTDTGVLDVSSAAVDGETQPGPVPTGEPVALLEIPSIGRSDVVVSGVGSGDLKKGPGHFPGTPLPGQLGNASIAGHRTSYGAPFHDIDELDPGAEIVVTTTEGRRWVYEVTGTQIVDAHDTWVIETSDPDVAELTLISCHPTWSASERIVVSAILNPAKSGPVAPTGAA